MVLNREVFGFFLIGGMIVMESGVGLWFGLQGATFGQAELEKMASELQSVTQWLISEVNWRRGIEEFEVLQESK